MKSQFIFQENTIAQSKIKIQQHIHKLSLKHIKGTLYSFKDETFNLLSKTLVNKYLNFKKFQRNLNINNGRDK